MAGYQTPKVLLTSLTERTSAKGNVYLTGWLAKARVVGFRAEDDDQGHPVWNLYLSEPEQRQDSPAAKRPPDPERQREQRTKRNTAAAEQRFEQSMVDLNDPIPA